MKRLKFMMEKRTKKSKEVATNGNGLGVDSNKKTLRFE
jgi:hypothetical protein